MWKRLGINLIVSMVSVIGITTMIKDQQHQECEKATTTTTTTWSHLTKQTLGCDSRKDQHKECQKKINNNSTAPDQVNSWLQFQTRSPTPRMSKTSTQTTAWSHLAKRTLSCGSRKDQQHQECHKHQHQQQHHHQHQLGRTWPSELLVAVAATVR